MANFDGEFSSRTQKALTRIGRYGFLIEALRLFTVAEVDQGL